MQKGTNWLRRIWIVAGLSAMAMSAQAFMLDPTITVDRALNSPTLTIRYSGANAALVELRVNGASLGTRSVTAGKQSGEANFSLDMSSLVDGKNDVEILLLDKTGRIVGSEKTTISADGSANTPVMLTAPKMGATVMGPVEIKVGFGHEMRNSYVSFFINNQFKAMTNFAPYSYVWDTTQETNGWHEVEAWLVDEASNTFKTRKVRVFVNNQGGRTNRVDIDPVIPVVPVVPKVVVPKVTPKLPTAAVVKNVAGTLPSVSVSGLVRPNAIFVALTQDAGTKPVPMVKASATGTRVVQPAGVKPVMVAPAVKAPAVHPVIEVHPTVVKPPVAPVVAPSVAPAVAPSVAPVVHATSMLRVARGFRTADRTLAISFNSQVVGFDVQPRVQNNIPLTPFRHLIEKAGGSVKWAHKAKTVDAIADGRTIFMKIGDSRAMVNHSPLSLEMAPFIEAGRTIVPLSFIEESLNVNVEYDAQTGQVLITNKKH